MAVTPNQVKGGILMVIGFMLTALLAGELLPTAFNSIFNASTSSWTSTTVTIWELLPLFVIIAVVLYFVAKAVDTF